MKKWWPLLFWIVLGCLVGHIYFHNQFPYTHDGENHLARFANYKLALRQGQFPPRWAPNLYHRFGYPVFIFNYPLANILSLPFSIIKVPYQGTFRLMVVVSLVSLLSGSWQLLKQLFDHNKYPGRPFLFALLALASSPVVASLLAFRGSIGEVLALGLFPWLVTFFIKLVEEKTSKWWLSSSFLLSVVFGGLFLLSHNITVLYGLPLAWLVASICADWLPKHLLRLGASTALAIGLTLWFWLPALAEKSAIVLDGAAAAQPAQNHLLTMSQLLVSPVRFGYSYLGNIDSGAVSFGVLQVMCLLIVSLVLLINALNKEKVPRPVLGLTAVSWALLFLQTSWSAFLWQVVPLVQFIQFPWRISLLTNLVVVPLMLFAWQASPKLLKACLAGMLVIQLVTMLRTQPADWFQKSNQDYDDFAQSTSTNNENLPKQFRVENLAAWQVGPIFLTASGSAQVSAWTGTTHRYQLEVWQPGIVVETTAVYPGWQTTLTNQQNQTFSANYIDSQQIQGQIAYQLNQPGSYQVVTQFTQNTVPRLVGNAVSLCTAVAVLLLFLYGYANKKK